MRQTVLYSLISLLVALATYLALPPKVPVSPLGQPQDTTYLIPDTKYIILGFAPYWNLKKLSPDSYQGITHFAYFAIHLDEKGGIYSHVNRREQDPGYTNYQRILEGKIDLPDKPLILTFMPIDEDALQGILSSGTSRANAINTIVASVRESGATGVNIDFEPVGDISPSLRNNFTEFINDLYSSLSPRSSLLTISIYPSAAIRPRLWDLQKLSTATDYFVVMTYDYTMPKSLVAGPNSPLRDLEDNYEHNVVKNIAEISSLVPPSKILLGIPLYGYEWDTTDQAKYAPTTSRGATASLERIEQMLRDKTLELLWDRNSLTPYGVSTSSGSISQIYFENSASIRLKLDLVKSSGLGGIALWALGYDNNVPWLWPTIYHLNQL